MTKFLQAKKKKNWLKRKILAYWIIPVSIIFYYILKIKGHSISNQSKYTKYIYMSVFLNSNKKTKRITWSFKSKVYVYGKYVKTNPQIDQKWWRLFVTKQLMIFSWNFQLTFQVKEKVSLNCLFLFIFYK